MTEELDLTPRNPKAKKPLGARSYKNWIIVSVLGLAGGFILFQALTNARVFFYNVDEAVAQREDIGDGTFRMQGEVLGRSAEDSEEFLFVVGFGGQEAAVRHVGPEPTDLFECGQNVVVEGRWADDVFESKQILVKHSEDYKEEYSERLTESEAEECRVVSEDLVTDFALTG